MRSTRVAAAAAGALLAVLLVPGAAGTAAAHPFGPPPTALVSAEDRTVTIRWTAAADDAAEVGVALGLLDESVLEAFTEAPTQVAPPAAATAALDAAPTLRAHLLEHLDVRQGGRVCPGAVRPIAEFLHRGATVDFTCPGPVVDVDIAITLLHDVHPAYRTFAVTDGDARPPQAVYTVDEPAHRWRFGEGGVGGPAGETGALGTLIGAFAAVTAGTALALRRLLRR